MIRFPNCKINLGLSVTEKRSDGFHSIETVFYPVPLTDILEIIETKDETTFESNGLIIPGNQSANLVMKAYDLLKKDFHIPPVCIYLQKKIPIGAGLGGGSSDAAFAIMLLNDLFSIGLHEDEMKEYAKQLGSDCAFFIENKPVFAVERGDKFLPIELSLANYSFLLVKPGFSVNTGEAYAMIKPEKKNISIPSILVKPFEYWQEELINDFEEPVFKKYPQIRTIKEKMYELGALYACMSGSGSTVFGIFRHPVVTENLFQKDYFIWQGRAI